MKLIGRLRNKIREILAKKKFHQRLRKRNLEGNSIKKIAIIYYIPKTNWEKYNNWEDGFTKAIDLLSEDYEITMYNLEDYKPSAEKLNQYDLVIGKSCWNWIVDNYISSLKELKTLKGIFVSCSQKPLYTFQIWEYDIIWYETHDYRKFLNNHPMSFHAFGINSDIFYPENLEKTIDILSIGGLHKYKRFEKLNDKPGNIKVIIGDIQTKDADVILKELDPSIEIKEFTNQKDLAKYINSSKLVYIPANSQGGGERAVLEAKACGVPVMVEEDNQKLIDLRDSPNFTKYDYYNSIILSLRKLEGINVNTTNFINSSKYLKVGRYSFYNKNFKIKGQENVEIGSFCSFGENITFITENHDTNFPATQGFVYRKLMNQDHPAEISKIKTKERTKGAIIVGNDVWIGDNVSIMPGVTIGDGACIAASSVVTKDVEPYSIYGGIPAKKIKNRFSDEVINFLLQIKWWNWTDKKISNNKEFFNLNLNVTDIETIKNCIK